MTLGDELGKLGELHARGILSDDEFARAKSRLLHGATAEHDAGALRGINGLRRDPADRWLGGVCGGLARSTGLASWIWRLIFVACVLCAGTGLLVYGLLWLFVPEETRRLPVPTRSP